MSASFEHAIHTMVETLRTHIIPQLSDDFARGQAFGIIYALEGLKLTGDWAITPLAEQVAAQDRAFAELLCVLDGRQSPKMPTTPRIGSAIVDGIALEALRDAGDQTLVDLLLWIDRADLPDPVALDARRIIRRNIRDQLKVEIATMPKSMFHQIATGREGDADH